MTTILRIFMRRLIRTKPWLQLIAATFAMMRRA
jgi:hypothetical protein